jgi:hypothetical protein
VDCTILEFTAGSLKKLFAIMSIGGDTSYHIADYATLANRFQSPFRWAFDDLKRAGKILDGARRPRS